MGEFVKIKDQYLPLQSEEDKQLLRAVKAGHVKEERSDDDEEEDEEVRELIFDLYLG